MKSTLLAVAMIVACGARAEDARPAVDVETYGRCVEAAKSLDFDNGLKVCRPLADEGVPGAQYAMGMLLCKQAGKGTPEATAWLEKAAVTLHPGALFLLAAIKGADPNERAAARDLLRVAFCGGIPPPEQLKSLTHDSVGCKERPDTDFTGDWSGKLEWTKITPGKKGGPELKVSIAGDAEGHVTRPSK